MENMKKSFLIFSLIFSILLFVPVEASEARAPVDPNDIQFNLVSSSVVSGTKTRCSPEAEGPCTISNSTKVSSSSTWSVTVSASYKPIIISKIEAELGISYAKSSTTSKTFTVTYNVPSGRIGSVYFTPYFYLIKFAYTEPTYGYRTLTTKTPKTVDGYTDGLFQYGDRAK